MLHPPRYLQTVVQRNSFLCNITTFSSYFCQVKNGIPTLYGEMLPFGGGEIIRFHSGNICIANNIT